MPYAWVPLSQSCVYLIASLQRLQLKELSNFNPGLLESVKTELWVSFIIIYFIDVPDTAKDL
jgi:hypothetical protein